MTGVKSNTRDHPWVARYLTAYLSQYSEGLFAGVGLILNTDHELHRDLHNQRGIDNLILPVVTSGGGLWIQDPEVKEVSQLGSDDWVVKQTPKGMQVAGKVQLYKPHQIIKLRPDRWHESVSATGQQLLLVGYTPRSLHKLDAADRDLLWSTGFTLLPASKDEYWGFDPRALVLTRHHRVPRRHMYAPSGQEWLPVARQYFGDVRYCVQRFRDGDPVRTMCMWRRGRGKAVSSTWTGSSSFKLRDPSSCAEAGGGESAKSAKSEALKTLEPLHCSALTETLATGSQVYQAVHQGGPVSSSSQVRVVLGAQGHVGYSRNLLEPKGIELEVRGLRKTTVCEEFPSPCPRAVALQCVSLEIRKFQKELNAAVENSQGSSSCGLFGGIGVEGNLLAWGEESDSWFGYRVPWQVCGLEPCRSTTTSERECFALHEVPWPVRADVSGVVDQLAVQHSAIRAILHSSEDGCNESGFGDDKMYWDELERLESRAREFHKVENDLLGSGGSVVLRSVSIVEGVESETTVGGAPGGDGHGLSEDFDDPPPLQTKIVSQAEVRRELPKWYDSIVDEHQSLVKKSEAVEELLDGEYNALIEDPSISVEVIPAKLVFNRKPTGRRKTRIVGCGNFCEHDSSTQKTDLFASGAGAESIRMMIRKCALETSWHLVSVDVKTAFLQAPLMDMQKDGKIKVTIVRVPSILREAGITTARYWRVKKALYGLSSAPRSWSTHRDKVLSDLRIAHGKGTLRLRKMNEDANLWYVLKYPCVSEVLVEHADRLEPRDAEYVGVIALYVDDILVASTKEIAGAVVKGLESVWELSSPDWLSKEGDYLKFAGFELVRTAEGIRLHQESYVRDLLEQCEDTVLGTERTPAVKMGVYEDPVDHSERLELTKRAQGLVGQLLWLSGRTRPDLAYAVSVAASKIVPNPREAVARAEHLVRYLRHAPGVALHYKPATGRCGRWNQLRHGQTSTTIEVYTDASFAADEQCRSFGSVQLFWGGALISWAATRQTLIAAHTAESELYSLAEGHLMGKAFRPTVAALSTVGEGEITCRLYCDNAAAVQLCVLEAGSWRTRHLRLRGAVIRQDLEREEWSLAHLDGVYMPADLGTKPVGPARLEDLLKLCDLWIPHLDVNDEPPRPSVAALGSSPSGLTPTLLALLMLAQVNGARAWEVDLSSAGGGTLMCGFVLGFGIGCGMWAAAKLGQVLDRCFNPPVEGSWQVRVSSGIQRNRVQSSLSQARGRSLSDEESPVDVEPSFVSVEVQTTAFNAHDEPVPGEQGDDPIPVQSEGNMPVLSSTEQELLLDLYDRLYQEQQAENRAVGGSSSSDGVELRPLPGGLDWNGSPEVMLAGQSSQADAVTAHFTARAEVDPSFVLPPSDMLAQARAPTVPMPPPGYPFQVVPVQLEGAGQGGLQGNRFAYVDNEVELGDDSDLYW